MILRLIIISLLVISSIEARADSIPAEIGELPLLVRGGIDDFGITVNEFAACMSLADFPTSSAPRTVEVARHYDGNGITLTTKLSRTYSFDIAGVPPSSAIVQSVRSGLEVANSVGEKMMAVGLFLERCQVEDECQDIPGEVPCALQGKISKEQWRSIESAMFFAISMPPETPTKWNPDKNLHIMMLSNLGGGCYEMALEQELDAIKFEWCPNK
ncbi:hypothetical protein [uncultured Ruegeria sp.]|uniref:hypothetical protein n=1 Tax=uncultured Ruegeria sp. TaxID=259304 RepID=UPI0026353B1D|nr:hypothetical protein [uncultured Ruegeria sp.]